MRNLKRALSLALASIMVLGMMVVGASATSYDDFSDKDQIVNKEAVSTLVELNVINGKDDLSFDPSGIITRAEMAKLICVVLNGGKDPQLGNVVTYTYADTVGHWAAGYIEYCTKLGIIAGDGKGNFNPNATVTGSEAAKMLLAAVGYQPSIEGYVGSNWEVSTNVRANNIGLYDGLDINPSEGLTRDSAAQMVYNALDARVVTYKYTLTTDGSTVSSIPELVETNSAGDKVTMLEDKFKAVKVEAVVTSNEAAALNNNYRSSDEEGETTIAVVNDKGVNGTYKVATGKDLLGESVYMYIKYKDDRSIVRDAVVIGQPIATEKNKIVESHDGTALADLLDDNKLTVNSKTAFYCNFGGTYDNKGNVTTMTEDEFTALTKLTGVNIKLVDNDDDKVVEYAMAEKYSYGSVSKYVESKSTDSFRVNTAVYDSDYDTDEVVGFDEVAQNDFVLFVEYGGKIYVQKPETLEGVLKDYSTSKKNVNVDDTVIDWSDLSGLPGDDLLDIDTYLGSSTALDANATFYLDPNGYLIAVGDADENALNYAVLLGFENQVAGSAGVLGSEAKAKLLLSDGTTKTYEVTHINGKKVTDCDTKGTKTGSQVGFASDDQYKIFSYILTDGSVKLTYKTTNVNRGIPLNTTATLFKNGTSTINVGASNYTVTKNTVFLYVKPDGSVARYEGKSSPSIDNGSGSAIGRNIAIKENNRGEALVVMLQGVNPQNEFKDNFLYVYKHKVSEVSDGYRVDAILNGEITTIIVPEGGATLGNGTGGQIKQDWYTDDSGKSVYGHVINNPLASDKTGLTGTNGLYSYSKNDDGTYDIKYADANNTDAVGFYDEGVVTAVSTAGNNAYIRLDTNGDGKGDYSYTLTNDSELFYARTDKTAETGVSVYKGDRVVLVHDEDNKIVDAFVIYRGYDMKTTDNTPVPPTGAAIDGNITIDKDCAAFPYITKAHVVTAAESGDTTSIYHSIAAGSLYIEYTLGDSMTIGNSAPTVTVTRNGVSTAVTMGRPGSVSGNKYSSVSTAPVTFGNASVVLSSTLPIAGYDVVYSVPTPYSVDGTSDLTLTSDETSPVALSFKLNGVPTYMKTAKVTYTVTGTSDDGTFTTTALTVTGGAVTVAGTEGDKTTSYATGTVKVTVTKVEAVTVERSFAGIAGHAVTQSADTMTVGTKATIPQFTVGGMPTNVTKATVTYTISNVTTDDAGAAPLTVVKENMAVAGGDATVTVTGANYTATGDGKVEVKVESVVYTEFKKSAFTIANSTTTIDSQTISKIEATTDIKLKVVDGEYTNDGAVTLTVTPQSSWSSGTHGVGIAFIGGAEYTGTLKSAATGNGANITITIPDSTLTINPAAPTLVVNVSEETL